MIILGTNLLTTWSILGQWIVIGKSSSYLANTWHLHGMSHILAILEWIHFHSCWLWIFDISIGFRWVKNLLFLSSSGYSSLKVSKFIILVTLCLLCYRNYEVRLPSVSKIIQATMPPDQREILDRWEQNMIEELGNLNNYFNSHVCLSIFVCPNTNSCSRITKCS